MTEQIENATPKGSFIIVRRETSYNTMWMGAYSGHTRFIPAVVTKASRTGVAKHVEFKHSSARLDRYDTVLAIPAEKMAGHSPYTVLKSLEQDYDTIQEVRAALLAVLSDTEVPTR